MFSNQAALARRVAAHRIRGNVRNKSTNKLRLDPNITSTQTEPRCCKLVSMLTATSSKLQLHVLAVVYRAKGVIKDEVEEALGLASNFRDMIRMREYH
eukprot:1551047-Amphidinium_carterae.4